MRKSISVKPAKRRRPGRPATGRDPIVGVRMAQDARQAVEAWAAMQPDKPSLSEAIRRLVERGLASEPKAVKPRRPAKKDNT
jgi:hypothetical protein